MMASRYRHTRGTIHYLARDPRYDKEKPYVVDFPLDHVEGAEHSNLVYDDEEVTIQDLRGVAPFELDVQGACTMKLDSILAPGNASNQLTTSMRTYLTAIEETLYQNLPQYSRIELLDFIVRKRSPAFPKEHGHVVDFAQPAALPHSDFSENGALMRMAEAFPGQQAAFESRSFDMLNVWHVLEGPNNDWPLAICDAQTIDRENDVAVSDAVHGNSIGENKLLHANSNHRWYYLSDQRIDEAFVFRSSDSEGVRPVAFHGAFENQSGVMDSPRQSIEIRLVAFRD